MRIKINGRSEEVESGLTVRALLESRRMDPQRVAVEVNAAIVKRTEFAERCLAEADTVEVLQFVGGG
jgi:sulfur carrier protein